MAQWFQSVVTGVTMGSIYALIALGFVSIYRTSRIINMAQGSFLMLGAFITFSFRRGNCPGSLRARPQAHPAGLARGHDSGYGGPQHPV